MWAFWLTFLIVFKLCFGFEWDNEYARRILSSRLRGSKLENDAKSKSRYVDRNQDNEIIVLAAGNFTVDKQSVNIARYQHGKWSIVEAMDLHTFTSEDGVIRDMAVLYTEYTSEEEWHPFELFVVGDFDTATKSSQLAYCSVGVWDGDYGLNKVGEGLCPRGNNPVTGVQIFATAIAGDENIRTLFVGGNFESRVWNGHHFLDVYNIAMYDIHSNSWKPLTGFQLQDDYMSTKDAIVTALSWDSGNSTLYVGGDFHIESYIPYPEGRVDRAYSRGVAVWNQETGLMPFIGGSIERRGESSFNVSFAELNPEFTREKYLVSHMFYDKMSNSLIVTGQFDTVGGQPCIMAALWSFRRSAWECLLQNDNNVFEKISTAYKDPNSNTLYLAGKINPKMVEAGVLAPGMRWSIAQLDISWYTDPDYGSRDSDAYRHRHSGMADSYGSESGHSHEEVKEASHHGDSPQNPESSERREHDANGKVQLLSFFEGTEGPIEAMLLGEGELSGTLIVAGKSDTGKSVIFVPIHRPSGTDTSKNGYSDDDGNDGDRSYYRGVDYDDEEERFRHVERDLRILGLPEPSGKIFSGSSIESASSSSEGEAADTVSLESTFTRAKLGGNQTLDGTIMTLVQVWIPKHRPHSSDYRRDKSKDRGDDIIVFNKNNISIIVIFGLLFSGGMGVLCAYYFFKSSFNYDMIGDEEFLESDNAFSMSLRTLSGGDNSSKISFQKLFRQAMQARHLPTHETMLLINPNEITLSRIIGEGSFGRVWSGMYHNNRVAVKEFVFAQAAVSGESLQRNRIIEEIVGEAGIMGCLRHPKILQVYGCSLTMQAIWITSELCAMGSLRMLLNNEKIVSHITFLQELSLCLDIADGCHYLHTRSPPIIHRDLKSHNIFIQEQSRGNYVAKIGDWGSARAVALADSKAKNMTRGIGTACWLAPEVINSGHSSVGSDVYAYGIILWEVMTRKEVYVGLTAEQIIAKVANANLRPHTPPNLPLRDIMASCWRHEAKDRPSFQQILSNLSRTYSAVKMNPTERCKRVLSTSNLLSHSDNSTEPILVKDETPIRIPMNLSGNYGSLGSEGNAIPVSQTRHEDPYIPASEQRSQKDIRTYNGGATDVITTDAAKVSNTNLNKVASIAGSNSIIAEKGEPSKAHNADTSQASPVDGLGSAIPNKFPHLDVQTDEVDYRVEPGEDIFGVSVVQLEQVATTKPQFRGASDSLDQRSKNYTM